MLRPNFAPQVRNEDSAPRRRAVRLRRPLSSYICGLNGRGGWTPRDRTGLGAGAGHCFSRLGPAGSRGSAERSAPQTGLSPGPGPPERGRWRGP